MNNQTQKENTIAPTCTTTKCVPCESLDKSTLLDETAIQKEISSSIPLWSLLKYSKRGSGSDDDGGNGDKDTNEKSNKISRKFTTKNFQSAIDFINQAGRIAEREGHHPDLHLTSYREVEVILFTHSVGGVTGNDILLAKMIDKEVKVCYSPKWLKMHPEAQQTAA